MYACDDEKMFIFVKRRRCSFLRRGEDGEDVYLSEEEMVIIFVKRRRCVCI